MNKKILKKEYVDFILTKELRRLILKTVDMI